MVLSAQPEIVLHLSALPSCTPQLRRSGTWSTNVMGSLHLLEALKPLLQPCAVVMVTTDKVYLNQEWTFGYREVDPLGGHDPYSASKAAAEIAIASWRSSFCGTAPHQTPYLRIATARAGNVIGGDWATDHVSLMQCDPSVVVRLFWFAIQVLLGLGSTLSTIVRLSLFS